MHRLPHKFYLIIFLTLFSALSSGNETSPLAALDDDYQNLLITTFEQTDLQQLTSEKTIDHLLDATADSLSEMDQLQKIAAIFTHRKQLENHLDDRRFPSLIAFLLDNGLPSVAEHFLNVAEQEAADYSLATIRLAFAHYYAERAQWQAAIQQISAISINNVLDPLEADHAYLIYGVALQGQRKHREAIAYYNRVRSDSPHYRLAQLNSALAYLRQEWWTDAQMAIENALVSSPGLVDETTDRLYTVLGFSQIQYGFYRRARDNFRKVSIDGSHANRALLGLGLSALHQNDKVGALNAFDHLKTKNRNDLSVAESYLLSAFTLSQIAKTTSAAAGYAEATAFYQQYLARIEQQLKIIESFEDGPFMSTPNWQNMTDMITAADAKTIALWVRRQNLLTQMREQTNDANTQSSIMRFNQQISRVLADAVQEALLLRQSAIESYLSQAHFGLAQLYDAH